MATNTPNLNLTNPELGKGEKYDLELWTENNNKIDAHALDMITQVNAHQDAIDDLTADKAYTTYVDQQDAALSAQLAETEQRIDNIIATPIDLPEIYVDEIHDARQGAGSLGANIAEVKSQLEKRANLPVAKTASQFYEMIQNAVTNGEGDIYLEDMIYDLSTVSWIVFPIDISNTAIRIHGIKPKITNELYNPDLTFGINGGSIIKSNFQDVFTGNNIAGLEFENFSFVDCGTCINFGATDVLGLAFSTMKNIYAYNCTGTFLKLTNIQQCYFEHIKSRLVAKGLHMINDHWTHSGPNSVIADFYCYPSKNAVDNTVNRGAGVQLDAIREPFSQLTMIRPQVNAFQGTEGTGSCFWANGVGNTVTGLVIIGGDLEGYVDKSFEGQNLAASSLDFVMCRGKYTVHLSNSSQQNKIHVADFATNRTDYGQIVSDNERNWFTGRAKAVSGTLSGMVYNESIPSFVIYAGYAADGLRISPNTGYTFRGGAVQNPNNGFGSPPTNLALYKGKFSGEIRADDGTNTAAKGVLCCWDGGIQRWVRPDGTNFAITV